jgi:hypothetical protein
MEADFVTLRMKAFKFQQLFNAVGSFHRKAVAQAALRVFSA